MKVLSTSKITWFIEQDHTAEHNYHIHTWEIFYIKILIIFSRRLFRTFQSCLKQKRFRYWAICLVSWSGEMKLSSRKYKSNFLSTLKLYSMCMHKFNTYTVSGRSKGGARGSTPTPPTPLILEEKTKKWLKKEKPTGQGK